MSITMEEVLEANGLGRKTTEIKVVNGFASEVGAILGSQIGSAIGGDNVFLRVGASTLLSATLKTLVSDKTGKLYAEDVFTATANEFRNNLGQAFKSQAFKSGAIGAISSYLTGEGLYAAANDNVPSSDTTARAA